MSEAIFDLFNQLGARKSSMVAGQWLFHADDPVEMIYLVVSGEIHLLRMTEGGAEFPVQRAVDGDILAEASVYSGRYHCSARVIADAQLYWINANRFRDTVVKDSALARTWAEYLAKSVRNARLVAEIRGMKTVSARLNAWLADGNQIPEKGRWQLVASELGVTREALYREMARRRLEHPTAT